MAPELMGRPSITVTFSGFVVGSVGMFSVMMRELLIKLEVAPESISACV